MPDGIEGLFRYVWWSARTHTTMELEFSVASTAVIENIRREELRRSVVEGIRERAFQPGLSRRVSSAVKRASPRHMETLTSLQEDDDEDEDESPFGSDESVNGDDDELRLLEHLRYGGKSHAARA